MSSQNISAGISLNVYKELMISSSNNLKDPYYIKLGAFSFDVKKNMMKAGNIDFTATMSTPIVFHGANLSKEKELYQL